MTSASFGEFQEAIRTRNDELLSRLRKATEPYSVELDGLALRVHPQVFCPTLGEGSRLIIRALDDRSLSGLSVMDLGTGTGALALKAAAAGAQHVVASDISRYAVECASANVSTHGHSERVEVRHGDLFEVLGPEERFDLILFNPPFLEGHAHDLLERAVFDDGYRLLRRFFSEVGSHLTDSGVALVAFGDVGSVQYLNLLIDGSERSAKELLSERYGLIRFFVIEVA